MQMMSENLCFDTIFKTLNDVKVHVLFRGSVNIFRQTFDKIQEDIDLLKNDKTVTDHNLTNMFNTISFLKQILLYQPIDKDIAEFINAWTFLLSNWNNNTAKNENLNREVMLCSRFLKNGLTIEESSNVLKKLIRRLEETKQWNPPAFEIAKHFISYLDDDTEEPEKSECKPKESEEPEKSECKPKESEEVKEEPKKKVENIDRTESSCSFEKEQWG